MRSNALLTVCSSVIFATNTLLWLVDRPSPTLASAPGAGYRCASTPGPFWTMGSCKCVATPPHDFCAGRRPPNSGDAIEFRYCTVETGFSCDLFQKPCGGSVWNCQFAMCDQETAPGSDPDNPWGCHETDKPPEVCSTKFYTWCDPVEYP